MRSGKVKGWVLRLRQTQALEPWPGQSLAGKPQGCNLTSLNFSFHIDKMEITRVSTALAKRRLNKTMLVKYQK